MKADQNGTSAERQRHKQGWTPTVFDRRSKGGRCRDCRHVDEFNDNYTCEAGEASLNEV